MRPSLLITGIGGFLGGHVAREFSELGWIIHGVDTLAQENVFLPSGSFYKNFQLPDENFEALLQEWNPDACIHCAGRASVAESFNNPSADFEASVNLSAWLISTLRKFTPRCKLVFLSSAAVYGNPLDLPIRENSNCQPISPYGYHKKMVEMLLEQAAHLFGQPCCSARIFSAYGAGLRRQVIWEICQQAARSSSIVLQGSGQETRDFIHASDVAAAVSLLVQNANFGGECYNIASGVEVKVSEIANLVAELTPEELDIQFQSNTRKGDPERWAADISKITSFGFKPKYDLRSGLDSVLKWSRHL